MASRFVDRFVETLFENGLESYDSQTSATTGIGGAKLFFHPQWKKPDSAVVINNPIFAAILSNFPATLYSVSRVKTKDGEPVVLPDNKGYDRTCVGLMLYHNYDEDPSCGLLMRDDIINGMKKLANLSPYVEVLSNCSPLAVSRATKALEQFKVRDLMSNPAKFNLHAAVVLALSSGAPGSSALWTSVTKKTANRQSMSNSTSAAPAEQGDFPF